MLNVCLLDQGKKPQITGKILFWLVSVTVLEDEISISIISWWCSTLISEGDIIRFWQLEKIKMWRKDRFFWVWTSSLQIFPWTMEVSNSNIQILGFHGFLLTISMPSWMIPLNFLGHDSQWNFSDSKSCELVLIINFLLHTYVSLTHQIFVIGSIFVKSG